MTVKEWMDHMPDPLKTTGDGTSIGVLVATLTDTLPAVAAIATIVWTLIRIYETETVQKILKKRKKNKDKE